VATDVSTLAGASAVSFYLSIVAAQPPFDIGVDAAKRQLFSCNFDAATAGDSPLLEDVVGLLAAASLGTPGADLFIGGAGLVLPTGAGPYVQLLETGGLSTSLTHDGDRYPRRSFQLIARAASYPAAEARAVACWQALDGRFNLSV